jgi:hypothetical protein
VQGSRGIAIRAISNLHKAGEIVSAIGEHILTDLCERVASDDGRVYYRVKAGKSVSIPEFTKLLSAYNTGAQKVVAAARMIRVAGVAERSLEKPDEVPTSPDVFEETQDALLPFAKAVASGNVVWGDPAFADASQAKPR